MRTLDKNIIVALAQTIHDFTTTKRARKIIDNYKAILSNESIIANITGTNSGEKVSSGVISYGIFKLTNPESEIYRFDISAKVHDVKETDVFKYQFASFSFTKNAGGPAPTTNYVGISNSPNNILQAEVLQNTYSSSTPDFIYRTLISKLIKQLSVVLAKSLADFKDEKKYPNVVKCVNEYFSELIIYISKNIPEHIEIEKPDVRALIIKYITTL